MKENEMVFGIRAVIEAIQADFSSSCFMFLYVIIFEIYHNKCPKIVKK